MPRCWLTRAGTLSARTAWPEAGPLSNSRPALAGFLGALHGAPGERRCDSAMGKERTDSSNAAAAARHPRQQFARGIKRQSPAIRASSDQLEPSARMRMLDSRVLEQFYPSVWMDIAQLTGDPALAADMYFGKNLHTG